VTVNGQAGIDTVIYDDSLDTVSDSYNVSGTQISKSSYPGTLTM
jgi:hypothetical protein